MTLFKLSIISALILNGLLIPMYIVFYYMQNYMIVFDQFQRFLIETLFHVMSYAAVISLVLFVSLAAVRLRSGYKGTRLMIGNRHLHEGTIGIVLVFIGVIWNLWHYFDTNFQEGILYTVGWWLAVGGLFWIIIGAVLIGRDWEDIKKGRFFNKEDE